MISEKLKILNNFLGYGRQQGNEHLYRCPYCNHHKNKLSVNLSVNVFKCWVCDARGKNIRRLVRRYGSYSNLKEWDKLTGVVDFSSFDFKLFGEETEEAPLRIDLPEEFRTLTGKISPADLRAHSYLLNRGLNQYDILYNKIGHCIEGDFAGRIIIPSFDEEGYVNYFMARTYSEHWTKYKNPNTSKNIIFNELNIDWDSDVILVEGIFDSIFAKNSIPLLGSTLREESKIFQKIIMNDSSVFVALDADAEDKAMKIVRNLLKYDIEVWKIDVPADRDIGDMSTQEFEVLKEGAILLKDNAEYILQRKIMSL